MIILYLIITQTNIRMEMKIILTKLPNVFVGVGFGVGLGVGFGSGFGGFGLTGVGAILLLQAYY